jgi:hypothetical protein
MAILSVASINRDADVASLDPRDVRSSSWGNPSIERLDTAQHSMPRAFGTTNTSAAAASVRSSRGGRLPLGLQRVSTVDNTN